MIHGLSCPSKIRKNQLCCAHNSLLELTNSKTHVLTDTHMTPIETRSNVCVCLYVYVSIYMYICICKYIYVYIFVTFARAHMALMLTTLQHMSICICKYA